MTDLESLLKEHYSAARMRGGRVDEILGAAPSRATPSRVWYARISALAAALVVGFGFLHVHIVERDTEARVLAEIAMNHKRQLAVEVSAGDFAAVERALDRLDIAIRPAGDLLADFDLLGGRYCSIEGGLAAQIKLSDRGTGRIHTLYATALTPALAGIADAIAVHDGVEISLWREGEVFFALAGEGRRGGRLSE